MSIQDDILELQGLSSEIKRLSKELKRLRDQKKRCESRIQEYLVVNNQPGVKMNGTIIMLQEREKRRPAKKSEKIQRGESVLQKHGIYNSRETLEELLEAMRGSPETTSSLKIY
jgi:transposase